MKLLTLIQRLNEYPGVRDGGGWLDWLWPASMPLQIHPTGGVYEEKRSFEMPYDFYKKKKKTSYQENQAKNRRASFRTKTAKPVRRGPRRSI